MRYILVIFLIFFSFGLSSQPFPIPKDGEVSFDVIRKKKIIGSLNTKFIEKDNELIMHSVLDIDVKVLFFPAYKFFQETKETWVCLLYTSPSPRDLSTSRMPSSA